MHTSKPLIDEKRTASVRRWGVRLVAQSVITLLICTSVGKYFYYEDNLPYALVSFLLSITAIPSFYTGLLLIAGAQHRRFQTPWIHLSLTPTVLYVSIAALLVSATRPHKTVASYADSYWLLGHLAAPSALVVSLLCIIGCAALIRTKPPEWLRGKSSAHLHNPLRLPLRKSSFTLVVIGFLIVLSSSIISLFIPGVFTTLDFITALAAILLIAAVHLSTTRLDTAPTSNPEQRHEPNDDI